MWVLLILRNHVYLQVKLKHLLAFVYTSLRLRKILCNLYLDYVRFFSWVGQKLYFEENLQMVVWRLLLQEEFNCSSYSAGLCSVMRSVMDVWITVPAVCWWHPDLSPLRELSRLLSPLVTWGVNEGCLQTPLLRFVGPSNGNAVPLRAEGLLFILSWLEQPGGKCFIYQ